MAEYNPYKAALIALVDLLKEQGMDSAGKIEGLMRLLRRHIL